MSEPRDKSCGDGVVSRKSDSYLDNISNVITNNL
jgi:hypothetical protein